MTVRLDNNLLSTSGSSGSTTATTTGSTFEILAKNHRENSLVSNAHLWDHHVHEEDRHDHQSRLRKKERLEYQNAG
jgi:hypothetical protein